MNIKLSLDANELPIIITLAGDNLTIAPQEAESAPATLEWSDTLLGGETVTYETAEEAVQTLGDGWRLPTRKELESLVDTSRHEPAIDTDKFPDTRSKRYWTSTPCAWNDSAVWVVYFSSGLVYNYHRSSSGCVRACRG